MQVIIRLFSVAFAALVAVFMVIYNDNDKLTAVLPEVNDQNCESNDVTMAIADKNAQLSFVILCMRRSHPRDGQTLAWSADTEVKAEPAATWLAPSLESPQRDAALRGKIKGKRQGKGK